MPGRTFEAAAILVYQSDLGSILTLRLIKSPSVQSPFEFLLYKIGYFDNNGHRKIGVKMAQRFSIFWITLLNCG